MMRPRHRGSDRGSATVWLVGASAALATFSLVVVYATGAVLARHRAQAAADLGALAAATRALAGASTACSDAAAVVVANGAAIVSCRIDGVDAIVTTTVKVRGAPPGIGAATATARAGR